MKRWKKGCLVALVVVLVAVFVAMHSRFGKMIAGFTLMPRIETVLEEKLEATVAVGGLDYRLWMAEVTLFGVEAESANQSWRFSLPEARLRFSPLGNVSVLASGPKITIRREDVGVPPPPGNLSRLKVRGGTVRALTSEGFEPRISDLDAELTRAGDGHRGVAFGRLDETRESFEQDLVWDASGLRVESRFVPTGESAR